VAVLAAQRGSDCLALDLSPGNMLGRYLGLPSCAAQGWSNALLREQWWGQAAMANSEGLQYLPHGRIDTEECSRLHAHWQQYPGWLIDNLQALDLPSSALVVMDAPSPCSPLGQQALQAADLAVVVLDASERSLQAQTTLQALQQSLAPQARLQLVVNRYAPRRPTQQAALELLRQQWGDVLLLDLVHDDEAICEALSQGLCVHQSLPEAQSAHDFQGLALRLLSELGPLPQDPP
jgi:cellulose synthase operon protein YhjQ